MKADIDKVLRLAEERSATIVELDAARSRRKDISVTLPDGVGGYAFEARDMTFLVLQDLKYTGGEVSVHVKMPKGKYVAADVFSGTSVSITQAEDGLDLHVVLLPNGSSLIVLRKESQ